MVLLLSSAQSSAASNRVQISKLTDVALGTIANLGVDAVVSQDVCLYSDTSTKGYQITAAGLRPGGAFELTSGAQILPYEVQWNSSPGKTTGTQLQPFVALTGLTSSATQQQCTSGPPASASLIIVIRALALSAATAGTYSGTLFLLAGPE